MCVWEVDSESNLARGRDSCGKREYFLSPECHKFGVEGFSGVIFFLFLKIDNNPLTGCLI